MFEINVSDKIRNNCPDFKGVAILAEVRNTAFDAGLWSLIDEAIEKYRDCNNIDDVKKHVVIEATRKAYRILGKDPNRYRPSSEALCRRILRNLPLYKVNTLVDLINLVSIQTGYCIGGFDADKIKGESLILGVGELDEPYEGIGRGDLNIEGLPVYRDEIGGIGTPTSDHERTKLDLHTTHLLTIINGYDGVGKLDDAVSYMQDLLMKYAEGNRFEIKYF